MPAFLLEPILIMLGIYKIGGNVINDPKKLQGFLKDFSAIPGKKILVHGGGKEASSLGKELGHEATMIDGRRVTDEETLRLVTMVYAGLINKRIVSLLQEIGTNAVGLTGADANLIPATKRAPFPVDYGFVGDINPDNINTEFLHLLLDNGYTPVVCAICRNPEGGLLNCNADSIAASLAIACAKNQSVELVYCFEKQGVLTDVNDETSVVPVITPRIFDSLKEEGKISGGMIPKVSNALDAVGKGVKKVVIAGSDNFHTGMGTIIHEDRN